MDNGLRATPANQWKGRGLRTIEVSPGYYVTIKPVDIMDLAASGHVPDDLSGIIAAAIGGEEKASKILDDESRLVSNIRGIARLYDAMVLAAVVDPPVVASNPGEGQVALSDFTFDEKRRIFEAVQEAARRLEPFRAQRDADVEPGDGG